MTDAMMLAIETSSFHGSVALGRGGMLIAERTLVSDRRHTSELLPAIRILLAESGRAPGDVEAVCFSQGPGSFTGIRVAATLARMWQSATGARVVAVPTLAVIARNALSTGALRVAVTLDARQGNVFGALFERSTAQDTAWRAVEPAALRGADAWIQAIPAPCAVMGDGVGSRAVFARRRGLEILPESLWRPHAREVLALGWEAAEARRFAASSQIVPAYLRPPECEEVYEERRAAAREKRGE